MDGELLAGRSVAKRVDESPAAYVDSAVWPLLSQSVWFSPQCFVRRPVENRYWRWVRLPIGWSLSDELKDGCRLRVTVDKAYWKTR